MDPKTLQSASQPATLARYLADVPSAHAHDGGTEMATVREDDYKGRHIVIRTTYHIEVNGTPFEGQLALDNAGRVHCHALPNYQFASAVEMVQRLIDIFPEDFPASQDGGHDTDGHGGGHEAGHGGSRGQGTARRRRGGR
jgi:hypothetical protein